MVEGHHSADVLSTYGASAVWKGLVAAVAAAHVPTVQQNTVTWLTEANHTGILYVFLRPVLRGLGACRHWSTRSWGFSQQSLKFPPLLLPLPANF